MTHHTFFLFFLSQSVLGLQNSSFKTKQFFLPSNYTTPELRVDDCGFVVGRAHLAGATRMVDGQHVTPHHAGPVVVRVETVLPAQLGGRVRGFCPHRLHGGRGHQLLTHPDP